MGQTRGIDVRRLAGECASFRSGRGARGSGWTPSRRSKPRCNVRPLRKAWIWLLGLGALFTASSTTEAEPGSLVFINGTPSVVFFNDGDSFRVIEGSLEGTKARLGGFNTLESHGPVHSWGTWTGKELYAIAKYATLNARRGVWRCDSPDMKRDGYGRILFDCPDLRKSQVRNGFAMVMTVGDDVPSKELLDLQWEAIVARRGIWAHGVPTYVMTSVHSADEGYEGKTYNRLVSPADGRSDKWYHNLVFGECEKACFPAKEITQEEAFKVVNELRADPQVAEALRGVPDIIVAVSVNEFITFGKPRQIAKTPAGVKALGDKLAAMAAAGRFASAKEQPSSCMVHVPFARWYRNPKPTCLKW